MKRFKLLCKIIAVGAAVMLLFLVVLTAVGFYSLKNMDSPFFRERIISEVQKNLGLKVSFNQLSVSPFSEIRLENLVLQQPSPFDRYAPFLFKVKKVVLKYRWAGILPEQVIIEKVLIEEPQIQMVAEKGGKTSIDLILDRLGIKKTTEKKPKSIPITKSLQLLQLPLTITLKEAAIEGLSLGFREMVQQKVGREITLSGISLNSSAEVKPGDLNLNFQLHTPMAGEPGAPDKNPGSFAQKGEGNGQIVIIEPGAKLPKREVHFGFNLGVQIKESKEISCLIDLDLNKQSFKEEVTFLGKVVKSRVKVKLDPQEKMIHLAVPELSLLTDRIKGDLNLSVSEKDGLGLVLLEKANLFISIDRLLEISPHNLDHLLSLATGSFNLWARDIEVDIRKLKSEFINRGKIGFDGEFSDLKVKLKKQEFSMDNITLNMDGNLKGLAFYTLNFKSDFNNLTVSNNEGNRITKELLKWKQADITFKGKNIVPDLQDPLKSSADLRLMVFIQALQLQGKKLLADNFSMDMTAKIKDTKPDPVVITGELNNIWAHLGKNRGRLQIKKTGFNLRAFKVLPDLKNPLNSRASMKFGLILDFANLEGQVNKGEHLDYRLNLAVKNLQKFKRLVPAHLLKENQIPLERLAFTVTSKGKIENPFKKHRLNISQQTDFTVNRISLRRKKISLKTKAIKASFRSSGGLQKQDISLDLKVSGAEINQEKNSKIAINSLVKIDFRDAKKPLLKLQVKGDLGSKRNMGFNLSSRSGAGPNGLTFHYDAFMSLESFGFLPRALPEIYAMAPKLKMMDLDNLQISLESKGELSGIIKALPPLKPPVLYKNLKQSIEASLKTNLTVKNIDFDDLEMKAKSSELRAQMVSKNRGPNLESEISLNSEDFFAQIKGNKFNLSGLDTKLKIVGRDLLSAKPNGWLEIKGKLEKLKQNIVGGYPIGRVSMLVQMRAQSKNKLRLDKFSFVNVDGGTELTFDSRVDRLQLPGGLMQSNLLVNGLLKQSLDKPDFSKDFGVSTSGEVELPFTITSKDLSRFSLNTLIKFDQVTGILRKPGTKLDNTKVEDINGVIRMQQEIALTPDKKIRIIKQDFSNAYARVTFSDVHPYLFEDSYFTVGSITFDNMVLGPIAGNLFIDRNLFALRQFQLDFGDGTVLGQMLLNFQKDNTQVLLRGKITDFKPELVKNGNRATATGYQARGIDANCALMFNLTKLEMKGRFHLVHISKHHLLTMLDILDPFHENVKFNQLRMALSLGYPKFVRLRLDPGFLSMKLELGGVAQLVDIGEIRGIPTGPLLEKYLGGILTKTGGIIK